MFTKLKDTFKLTFIQNFNEVWMTRPRDASHPGSDRHPRTRERFAASRESIAVFLHFRNADIVLNFRV